jgi:hypothetical protein
VKNILILPVALIAVYAFATPEYRYSALPSNDNTLNIYQVPAIVQKEVKGINPLLDAESVWIVSMLSGFKPGSRGGKPVNVWYMAPVTFSLPASETLNK